VTHRLRKADAQHPVVGLDVAVEYLFGVRGLDAAHHLQAQREGRFKGKRAPAPGK
jgi:hypothetical protein